MRNGGRAHFHGIFLNQLLMFSHLRYFSAFCENEFCKYYESVMSQIFHPSSNKMRSFCSGPLENDVQLFSVPVV